MKSIITLNGNDIKAGVFDSVGDLMEEVKFQREMNNGEVAAAIVDANGDQIFIEA